MTATTCGPLPNAISTTFLPLNVSILRGSKLLCVSPKIERIQKPVEILSLHYDKDICGATKHKKTLGCTESSVKLCNLHHKRTVQIAHLRTKLSTPKRLILLGCFTFIVGNKNNTFMTGRQTCTQTVSQLASQTHRLTD